VYLDATSSHTTDPNGWIQAFSWNLGDGTTSTDGYFTHTYASAGSYTVTLTATAGDGTTSTATQVVQVGSGSSGGSSSGGASSGGSSGATTSGGGGGQQPVAVIAGGPFTGNAPLAVYLDATTSYAKNPSGWIQDFSWNLGDGTITTDAYFTHTYQSAGSYTVVLTATAGDGTTSTATQVVQATVPCADTTPGPLGTPLSYTVPPSSTNQVVNHASATGDANGYLAFSWGQSGGDGIAIVENEGEVLGTSVPILQWILPQPNGFFADASDPSSSDPVIRFDESGATSAAQLTDNYVAVGNDPTGGLVAVFYSPSRQATLSSFDTAGNERWSYAVSGGPYTQAVVGADVLGEALLLLSTGSGSPGSSLPTQGQWFDANGVPGPTFAVNSGLVVEGFQRLDPQVAGGLFLYSGAAGGYSVAFASGTNAASAPPSWLAGQVAPVHLVFGGQAYATVSPVTESADGHCDAPTLEVFSPGGQLCGSVPLPPSAYEGEDGPEASPCSVDVGLDGTLVEMKPFDANCGPSNCAPNTNGCYCAPAWQFWPGYLR